MTDGQKEAKEIIYELFLLAMEIIYTINREIFKEIKRIFCCKKEDNDSINEEGGESAEVPLQ